jgi:hypothetical protein
MKLKRFIKRVHYYLISQHINHKSAFSLNGIYVRKKDPENKTQLIYYNIK